jgi:phenylalanyl-tRNA synthetase beta chain
MKIPYRWVREFVELSLSAEQARDRLVNAGVEVASLTPIAPDLKGVVIGEIEAIERELGQSRGGHRLHLCRVSTGRERFSVVCGAPNTAAGLRTAFAPPGAVLPGGRRVEAAKLHGVTSEGMLCSERELGLGEEHDAGVLVLGADAPLGADLVSHLGLDDVVLEIEITPNRPDCLSVVGVARELAALTGAPFRPPKIALDASGDDVNALARVRIEAPDLCHRFTGRVITDVTVGPSPAWMAARLRAVGLRPISNVVDVTNYVMWEIGHPLHAFDYDTVAREDSRPTIVVRRARPDERMKTLDGQTRALDPTMLLIADPSRGIGIAGVMGGAETEVTTGTARVLLEAAYFLPASIRRTSRTLGLKSDAAYRFERGADIDALIDGGARAAQLIQALGGGRIARGVIDEYPTRHPRPRVRLRMSRVKRILGIAPPAETAVSILTALGLPARRHGEELDVEVPSFRRDLTMEDDLVEEVIRVWGYDRIPSTLPGGAISLVRLPETRRQDRAVRAALVGAGLAEAVTYSFSSPAQSAMLRGPEDKPPVELLNPMSEEASVLRSHPLEGLLGAVATNVRRRQANVRLFEIAVVFNWGAPGAPQAPQRADRGEASAGPSATFERRWATIALTGARTDATWSHTEQPVDVYDAKGLAEHVLAALGVQVHGQAGGRLAGFETDSHGVLVAGDGAALAEFGEVAVDVRNAYGIETPVFAAVIDLDAVAARPRPPVRYEPLPRFPAVQRDMAFVAGADQQVAAADVEAALREHAGPLLRDVTLFDVFRFPDGRRSLAWRLTFQAADRTLTDEEVNAIHAEVTGAITRRFGLVLRSA